MRLRWLVISAVCFTTTAWSADPAPSPDAPEKVVAYREKAMKAAANHLGLASMIAKGEIHRPSDMTLHAEALHDLGASFAALFPEGTGPDKVKSESKPDIWTQHDKFLAAAAAFETETQKLVDVAKTGDVAAYKAQTDKVGQACGSCHEPFRVEDEH